MKAHHGNQATLAALNADGCRSKIRYSSKRRAMASGRQVLDRGHDTAKYASSCFNAYKCKTCGCWHLGHLHKRQITDASSVVHLSASVLEQQLADALRPYL